MKMALSEEMIVARREDTAWQVVEERAVVVTPRDRKIHILDGTGGRIWGCIERPASVGSIVETIVDEFEIDSETAMRETAAFLEELLEKGMIEVREDTAET